MNMTRIIKNMLAIGLIVVISIPTCNALSVHATSATEETSSEQAKGSEDVNLDITSPSVLLMELNSGAVLYEKDADTARRPASVTKIMTMLLAFDAIDDGKFSLEDTITVSEHAAGMGLSLIHISEPTRPY